MSSPSAELKGEKRVDKEESSSSFRRRSKKKSRKRKVQSDDKKLSASKESSLTRPVKRKRFQPLNGVVLSVSTLIGDSNQEMKNTEVSYNSVCRSCQDLGAEVMSQVCKRVQLLLCTHSAVEKSTQRVRKAFKKGIPIVDFGWLESCRLEQKRVDYESFRLDKEAEIAINSRQDAMEKTVEEILPETGWTEVVNLGCCCICHENGTEKDCKWCVDCIR